MMIQTQTLQPRLMRRQCVACGYDGSLLRNGYAPCCARCGCDLRERPARSYAEMEGLLATPRTRPQTHRQRTDHTRLQTQLRRRWYAFTFLAMLCVLVLVYLSTATFSL